MERMYANTNQQPNTRMSIPYNAIQTTQNSRIQTMPVVSPVSKQAPGVARDERGGAPNPPADPSLRYIDTQRAVHSQYVMQLLQLQRRAGFLCDITIHVRDRSFKAHKPLLAACSLYFRSLFADAAIKDSAALDLNILTPSGFEVLLDYIYSGSLAITAENSTEVLSAATCLQMTNVVETCLNFMRSSFRMCRTNDPLQPNQPQMNGLDLFNPKQWPPGVAGPSPHRMMAPPSKMSPMSQMKAKSAGGVVSSGRPNPIPEHPQDNLQILSTGSINEAEFKSIIEKSNASVLPTTPPKPGLVNGDPVVGADGLMPSTSQLQSVLPLLLTKEARQPTLQEVQQFLSSIPHPAAQQQQRAWENSHDIVQSRMTLVPQLPGGQEQLSQLQTSLNRRTSTDKQLNNNKPNCSNTSTLSVHSDVIMHGSRAPSGDEFPTVSASAIGSAPEQYSGEPVSVSNMPTDADCKEIPRITNSQVSVDGSEMDNHLEISDDDTVDGDEHPAWSADRSDEQQNSPTDLSGTPCKVLASVTSTPPCVQKTLANLDTGGASGSPAFFKHREMGTKSASVPSSPSKIWGRNVRAGSSVSDTTDMMRGNHLIPEQQMPDGETEGSSPTTILTKAIRTSLLPPRSSPAISTSGDLGPEPIKIELLSDEEIDAVSGGFPVQDDVTKQVDVADDASTVSNTLSRSSMVGFDSPGKSKEEYEDGRDEGSDGDSALDLSMPQRARAFRSSEESEAHAEEQDGDKNFPLPLIRTPSQTSERTIQDTESESELGFRQLDQQDEFCSTDLTMNGGTMTQQNRGDMSSAAFSRKPRRTTGGQTCTWPGCGRLFRHRNIYEEHQRLHELGIPVSQLRKCYMGARVKKTVREQLEELRTSDSAGDLAENEAKHKNRKRKGLAYGQESVRKRVTVKDRMSSFTQPQTSQLDQMQMQQSQLRYLAQIPPRHPVPSGYPGMEMHSPRGMEPQKIAQQILPPGLVRYPGIQGSTAAGNHIPVARFSANSLPSKDHHHPPVYSSMPQANHQLVNPVEQTLALLGIPTPVRRGDGPVSSGVVSATMSELSMDQIRRRLALRETSAEASVYTGGSIATPSGTTGVIMSGTPVAVATRPGTVMGIHETVADMRATAPRFFGPGAFPVNATAPQVAANGIVTSVPRPIHYPGHNAGSVPLNRGAQCS